MTDIISSQPIPGFANYQKSGQYENGRVTVIYSVPDDKIEKAISEGGRVISKREQFELNL